MAYNRWLTPNNPYDCGSSELYHHGVKGMKWGKHLFGKGTVQAGPGGGGGGILEEEPSDEEYKKAQKEYEDLYAQLHGLTPDQMAKMGSKKVDALYKQYYAALDNVKTKEAEYKQKKAEYEKTLSYKIKNPGETIKKAVSAADDAIYSKKLDIEYGIKDAVGITAKNAKDKAEKTYQRTKKYADRLDPEDDYYKPQLAKEKADYENALKDYYKTPIGKIDMYRDSIKKAKEFVNSPKVDSWDAYYEAYDAKHERKKETVTRSPSTSRFRSRKRNISGKGKGVQIRQPLLTKRRAR